MNRAIFNFSIASNLRIRINVASGWFRWEYAVTLTAIRGEYPRRLMADQAAQVSRISALALGYSASSRSRSWALSLARLDIHRRQRINSLTRVEVNRPRRPLGFVRPLNFGFIYLREFFLAPQTQRHTRTLPEQDVVRSPEEPGRLNRSRLPPASHGFLATDTSHVGTLAAQPVDVSVLTQSRMSSARFVGA